MFLRVFRLAVPPAGTASKFAASHAGPQNRSPTPARPETFGPCLLRALAIHLAADAGNFSLSRMAWMVPSAVSGDRSARPEDDTEALRSKLQLGQPLTTECRSADR